MKPNTSQLLSLLRAILQVVGTILVSHGTLGITGAMWEQISGGVLVIAPVIWSMYAHTDAAKIAEVVKLAADPASPVQGVITTADAAGKDLANSIEGPIVPAGSTSATEIAKS